MGKPVLRTEYYYEEGVMYYNPKTLTSSNIHYWTDDQIEEHIEHYNEIDSVITLPLKVILNEQRKRKLKKLNET